MTRLMQKYTLAGAFRDAATEGADEVKTPAELEKERIKAQREGIAVEVTRKETEKGEEETKEEVEEEEKAEEETKEEVEAKKEEIAESEKTEEELEKEKEAAKDEREKLKIQKKIDREVAKRKVLEDENADLKRQLAAKPDADKVLTEEDVEKLAEAKSTQRDIERQFTKDCNMLATEGTKLDKDFNNKVNDMAKEVEPIPSRMVGILSDLDNGPAVLLHLANNTDEYEDLMEFKNSDKLAVKLTKLSEQLKPKPKVKEVSKLPDPNNGIKPNGRSGSDTTLHSKLTDKEWIDRRNADVAKKRMNGRTSLR